MSIHLQKNLRVLLPCLATIAAIMGLWLADLPSLHLGRAAVAAEGQQSQIPQDEFEQRIRNYLLAHPEVVGEALSRLEAKQGELQAAAAKAALKSHEAEVFQDPDSPVGGNPNGNVTLVEFFDYNCPYCRALTPLMAKAEAADPQLRIVYKEFPILGKRSVFAAKAALAANKQASTWPSTARSIRFGARWTKIRSSRSQAASVSTSAAESGHAGCRDRSLAGTELEARRSFAHQRHPGVYNRQRDQDRGNRPGWPAIIDRESAEQQARDEVIPSREVALGWIKVVRSERKERRTDMRERMFLLASIIAVATAAASPGTAAAQDMHDGMCSGMMQGGMGQGMMREGMGQQRSDQKAMHGDMGGMMCPMMRSGMMQGGGMMGSGMMGSGMMGMGKMGGEAGLFGSRVTPMMNLSVDDVRAYLSSRLERLNNKRLKIGDINSGDATITADIVTVDNSLVQRLKVDRHSGSITYVD
jgi:protein-disulfide isomerase